MTSPTTDAQKSAARLGMWVFLGSEVLFFGGLFLTLTVYRHLYPSAFSEGTKHLSLALGTLNTAFLLSSSASLALALEILEGHHEDYKIRLPARSFAVLLSFTIFLGTLFLVIKGYEYYQHYREGLFPVWNWNSQKYTDPHLALFFVLYFCMTALHALHLTLGVGLLTWLRLGASHPGYAIRHESSYVNVGLYWHFVDVIWIFIFPLLYLVGRN